MGAQTYWDKIEDWKAAQPARVRWWGSPRIIEEINYRTCGKRLPGEDAGIVELMRQYMKIPLTRGVSIGCGAGGHEVGFIKAGLVSTFDLYDVSETMIQLGRNLARDTGVAEQANFRCADAFAARPQAEYDFVFWGSSLHHMPDVHAAMAWSHGALKPGGWVLLNEYVGANRFQWPRRLILVLNIFRACLPEHVFDNPKDERRPYSRYLAKPSLADMDYDPTEALDSERIIDRLKFYFPDAVVKNIGGNVYHLGLSDILTNIPEDSSLLKWSLRLDRLLSFMPHYIVAFAQKS